MPRSPVATVTEGDLSALAGPLEMLKSVRRAEVCYYIGSGYDLINPIINTECRRLVCVDLIDRFFYPALNLGLGLSGRVERDVHLYGVIDRFVAQWVQLSDVNPEFGRISGISVRKNRFHIQVSYKKLKRDIVFYSGVDGNKIPGPKEIRGCERLVLYISMGYVLPSTIQKLRPVQVVVYHTRLKRILKRRRHGVVIGSRIDPFSAPLRVFINEKYRVFR